MLSIHIIWEAAIVSPATLDGIGHTYFGNVSNICNQPRMSSFAESQAPCEPTTNADTEALYPRLVNQSDKGVYLRTLSALAVSKAISDDLKLFLTEMPWSHDSSRVDRCLTSNDSACD